MGIDNASKMVLNITDESETYAKQVCDQLKASGIRAAVDLNNDKINIQKITITNL